VPRSRLTPAADAAPGPTYWLRGQANCTSCADLQPCCWSLGRLPPTNSQLRADAGWGAQRRSGRRHRFHCEGGESTPEAEGFTYFASSHKRNHRCRSCHCDQNAIAANDEVDACIDLKLEDGSCPRRQLAGWLAALLICLAYSSAARWTSVVVWCWQLLGSACGVPRGGSVPQQARRFCTLTMLLDSFEVVCYSWHVRWLLPLLGCFPPPGSQA
jgi:hypothetical protein